MHDDDALGIGAGQREVVGDEAASPCGARARGRAMRSRIAACVVVSRPVVGSSAIEQRRDCRQARSRSSPAGTCRRTVRPDRHAPASPVRECARREARHAPLRAACDRARPRCSRMTSAICRPMVRDGLSAARGFWKTMPISRPRSDRPGDRASPAVRSTPPKVEPVGAKAGRRSQDAGDRVGEQRLARAAFADQRDDLAAGDVEAHVVDSRGGPSPKEMLSFSMASSGGAVTDMFMRASDRASRAARRRAART